MQKSDERNEMDAHSASISFLSSLFCTIDSYTLDILSYDCVQEIAVRTGTPRWPRIHLEDINTAFVMEEYKKTFSDESIKFPVSFAGIEGTMGPAKCDERGMEVHSSNGVAVVFHYCSPQTMYRYYKSYRETHGAQICKSVDISEYM